MSAIFAVPVAGWIFAIPEVTKDRIIGLWLDKAPGLTKEIVKVDIDQWRARFGHLHEHLNFRNKGARDQGLALAKKFRRYLGATAFPPVVIRRERFFELLDTLEDKVDATNSDSQAHLVAKQVIEEMNVVFSEILKAP
ncbi:MAG: hypothetical protein NTV51_12720 [Verrucomicrobia bacterium]|nr:hypothetical protein [Verrucomicrobiota bacterium]